MDNSTDNCADNWVEPIWDKLSWVEPSWAELSQVEPNWAKLSQVEPSLDKIGWVCTKKMQNKEGSVMIEKLLDTHDGDLKYNYSIPFIFP